MDLQTTGGDRSPSHNEVMTRPPRQDYLLDWCTLEKPWDPIQGTIPTISPTEYRSSSRPSGPAFSVYRTSHAASDCDTNGHGHLPSDSGYESLSKPRHSVAGGSTYGDYDRFAETASVSNGLAGLNFDRTIPSPESWRQQAPLSAIDLRALASPEKKPLVCSFCNTRVKTKSELKYEPPLPFQPLSRVAWLMRDYSNLQQA